MAFEHTRLIPSLMMKKLVCLLILTIAFTSCKKDEDNKQPPKLVGWRTPNCGSTIGEGVYEAFNDSESKYLITQRYPGVEEALDTSVVSEISLTSHTVTSDTSNKAFFEYKAHQPLNLDLVMLLNYDQQMSMSGQVVDSVSSEKTRFNLVNALTFGKKGCHRLYYVFTQQLSPTKLKIVNKGHFDIDIR